MVEATKRETTDTDLLDMPMGMGERYELIEGELVVMSPAGNKHGKVAGTVAGVIYLYLKEKPIGVGVAAETGFYTRGDKRTVRAPDYALIWHEKIPAEGLPDGYSHIVPDLVVEVVSPFDRANEIEQKVKEWLDFGVRLVWVLYPDTEHVHVYQQGAKDITVLDADDTLNGGEVLPEFSVTVKVLFGR